MYNINFCKNTKRVFENDTRRIRKELGVENLKKQRDEVTRAKVRVLDMPRENTTGTEELSQPFPLL